MTKIDELIKSICNKGTAYSPDWYSESDIEDIMKEYAEYYAKRCLQEAAENAKIRKEFTLSFGNPSVYFVKEDELNNYSLSISNESITDITLPEHD